MNESFAVLALTAHHPEKALWGRPREIPHIFPATTLLVLSSTTSWGGSTDLQFVPTSSAGHDFNHAPIGQSFKALTSNVKAGIFITDEDSFTTRLSQTYPGLPPFPYAVAPKWRTRGDTVHRFPTGPREVPGS